MAEKLEIYLDTSVPNAFLDSSKPERQKETKAFWNRLNQYIPCVSGFVIKEIEKTTDKNRKENLLSLIKEFKIIEGENSDIEKLTQAYVTEGAIAIVEDALHVAIAVVNGIGILTSWNYRHLVKLKTKKEVNAINLRNGYNIIEIVDPSTL